MATLYIHIGMTKTGSTTIEATFHESRGLLLKHGVDYLDLGQNHNKIMAVAVKNTAKGLKGEATRILGLEKDETDYSPELVIGEIRKRFQALKVPAMVISGQGLLGLKTRDIERMREFVEPHFDTVKIIVYVRDPTGWASSRAQEHMKRGHSLDWLSAKLAEEGAMAPIVPKYRAGIETYIRVFGRENVDIRVFDRRRFPNGDLLADFCIAVGVPAEVALELPRNWNNRGASAEALLLIQAHYDLVEQRMRLEAGDPGVSVTDEDLAKYRKPSFNFPVREAVRNIRGVRFALPKTMLDEIWRVAEPDIAWLRETTGEADLFADAFPPGEAPVPLWADETLRDLAAVIEEGLGDRMDVENRRTKLPKPARRVWRMWHSVRRRIGL